MKGVIKTPITAEEREKLNVIDRLLEDAIAHAVKPKLAILIKLAAAEQQHDHDGSEQRLDVLFWEGVECLVRDVLRDIERVEQAAGTGIAFVMLPDDSGTDDTSEP